MPPLDLRFQNLVQRRAVAAIFDLQVLISDLVVASGREMLNLRVLDPRPELLEALRRAALEKRAPPGQAEGVRNAAPFDKALLGLQFAAPSLQFPFGGGQLRCRICRSRCQGLAVVLV